MKTFVSTDLQSASVSMKVASLVDPIDILNFASAASTAVTRESSSTATAEKLVRLGVEETITSKSAVSEILLNEVVGRSSSSNEDPIFVGDLGEVVRQYERWCRNLPRIEPFYAVKCNTDAMVLSTLVSLGIGFDCASRDEISTMLDLGVKPEAIIYANPCKQASHIRFASGQNVQKMTFDNAEELYKIKQNHSDAQLVLRIITDDSHSVCKFSTKFGASLDRTQELLAIAKSLNLNVIGVSFHVGSGCFDAQAYRAAVESARTVFDQGKEVGYDFTLLDIGGGFPGNYPYAVSFEQIAEVLRESVDEMFPANVRVIAEPGRFFVASAFTLAVNITAKRTVISEDESKKFMFYVNDGVYGSFNCIMFDHATPEAKVLMRSGSYFHGKQLTQHDLPLHKCSIWGPTCDSMDCITRNGLLPNLDIGDWLYFDQMGAYTIAAASCFNGFRKTTVVYTNTSK